MFIKFLHQMLFQMKTVVKTITNFQSLTDLLQITIMPIRQTFVEFQCNHFEVPATYLKKKSNVHQNSRDYCHTQKLVKSFCNVRMEIHILWIVVLELFLTQFLWCAIGRTMFLAVVQVRQNFVINIMIHCRD